MQSKLINRFILRITAFSLLFLITVPCSAGRVEEHAYGGSPAQTLTVCMPSGKLEARPGALLIHGGAWVGGDKAGLLGRCQSLARNGILAVSINYRLADPADPSTRWPAQLADAASALQWMIDHKSELGLDPGRITVYGESAGGHIAMWLGIKDKRVASVIDAFGPADLTRFDKRLGPALTALTGDARDVAKAREASPVWFVGPDLPPTMIFHGEKDDLISPEQSKALCNAINAKGASATLVMYPGGHSWMGLNQQSRDSILARMISFIKQAPPRIVPGKNTVEKKA